MIDTQIQSYDEKKTLEQMIRVVEAKQEDLLEILKNAETTKDDLNQYMNTIHSAKGKVKADLQAYVPEKLDADFTKIANELDVAISETSKHLLYIAMQTDKKVKQHCKNKEKEKQDTKKDLEDAIDEANCLISVLNESALNSKIKLKRHVTQPRKESITSLIPNNYTFV